MYSICAVGGALRPDAPLRRLALDLGLACQFASRLPGHAQMPLGGFVSLAMAAQQVGQLKTYLNGYGDCVGYVIWALLTPDAEREFIGGKARALADWEFSDGTNAWILDLAVAPGSLPYVLEDLRDNVFKDHDQVTYTRLRGGKRLCKRVSRNDRTSFMMAGRRAGGTA